MNFTKTLVAIALIATIAILNLLNLTQEEPVVVETKTYRDSFAFGAVNPVGGKVYYVSGGGVSSSATSIGLTEFTMPVSEYKFSMSDFGTIGYGTLEPGSATRQEFVSFTGITQNADGTATLTGVTRGLAPVSPYTASTTLQKSHSGGTTFVISNPPQLYNLFTNKNNTEYITGSWGFQGTAPTSTTCASANELCNKNYVDNSVKQGAATSTETNGGIVELATALETASSTPTTANIPYVLQAQNATDTPTYGCATGYTGTTGAGCTVIANLLGKVSQSFLDIFSTANTWSLLQTFSSGIFSTASSTLSATTTIAASDVNGSPLNLNGLAYAFSSTRAASSTVLSEDGSGGLSFNSVATLGAGHFLYGTTTNQTFTDTVGAQTYTGVSYTLPANTLGSNGAIRFTMPITSISDTGSNSTYTMSVNLGGTAVCGTASFTMNSAAIGGMLDATLYADGATNSQKCIGNFIAGSASTVVRSAVVDNTSSVDTTSAQALTVTITQGSDGVETETSTINGFTATFLGRD